MDSTRYEEYCRQRYNYQQMKDRERQQLELAQNQSTVGVMLETLRAAISCPITQVKETAMNQARRMAIEIQKQYRYAASLKNKVLNVLDEIGELTLVERNTIVGVVDQFLT